MMIQAKTYTSATQMLASAQAVRKRLMMPARAKTAPVAIPAPVVAEPAIDDKKFSHHVKRWRRYKDIAQRIGMRAYVETRCMEEGFDVAAIYGRSQNRAVANFRQRMMAELKVAKPELSLPQIGMHFDRDHTCVILALAKYAPSYTGKRFQEYRTKARALPVGVSWEYANGKYRAYFDADNKRKYLGLFDHIEDAIAARKAAERERADHAPV